ncbi:Contactin-associated protein like 5-1 [Apodemus speciosus]|uniref:Contactin-associated protein like 5-1 n=1 Tax=Apodemus speciosus TaxID=105296 RepID=A0ABQ0EED7_APOSI
MTFVGNINADSVVHHKLLHSMRARFVRFVPLEWSPNGKIGMRVEVYGCSYRSDIADFDGRSSLLYRFNQKTMSTLKDVISLKFKSMQGDGVLFHGEGHHGDHITLELQKGRLALYLNLDGSKTRLSSIAPSTILGSLLDDQHWHSVLLERVGKQANFTVDMNTQHFQIKSETDALDIDYELSFGGIPVPSKPGTFLKKNFHGCIENLYYNGVNIIDLAKRRKHQSTQWGHDLNDGLWHSVSINARRNRVILTLDNDATSLPPDTSWLQIYSGNSYYFGDRCLPNYCEHGGHCAQTWSTFYCNCSDTDYTGATCHDSIYEQSCEVYRHRGNPAGFFYVDSDGSGPLEPLQVYCNVTG